MQRSVWFIVEVEWNIYVQCGRYICSGACTNDGKCMYIVFLITLLILMISYEA